MSKPKLKRRGSLYHSIATCPKFGATFRNGGFCMVCDLGVSTVRPKPAPKVKPRMVLATCVRCGGATKPDDDDDFACMTCGNRQPGDTGSRGAALLLRHRGG